MILTDALIMRSQHCEGLDKPVVYVAVSPADGQNFGNFSSSPL